MQIGGRMIFNSPLFSFWYSICVYWDFLCCIFSGPLFENELLFMDIGCFV